MIQEEIDHGRGFLFLPVWIGLGAILWFSIAAPPPALLLGLLAVLGLLARKLRYTEGLAARLPMVGALVLTGALLAQFESFRRETILLDTPVTTTITGRIDRREATGENRWRYLIQVTGTENPRLKRPPERIMMTVRGQKEAFATGNVVKGRARLSPPSGPALPGLNDFAFSAYFDGIGAHGFFLGKPEIQSSASVDRSLLQTVEVWLFDVRSRIGDRIRATVPGDAGAFAAALVTDERRAISRETTEALRLSGLAHIIAISGLNMALAAGIFFVGVRTLLSLFPGFAQRYPVKKFAAAGALVTACAYYLISGFAVSAERAFLMMAILLIAVMVDRPSISLRNIALSAIVIIAMAPSEIMGPSFQMSFMATLALVAGYDLWQSRSAAHGASGKPERNFAASTGRFIAGVFMTSVIGSLSTAIFSIEHFHKLATYGLAANLAAMPVISFVIMPAGLIAMLLMPLGLDAVPLKIMGSGLDAVIWIAHIVAGWGGEIAFGRQPTLFLPLAVSGLLLLLLLRTRLRFAGLLPLAVAGSMSFMLPRLEADLLISGNGQLVAIRNGDTLNSNRIKPEGFLYDQWQRALLISRHAPPQMTGSTHAQNKGSNKRQRNEPLNESELSEAETQLQTMLGITPDRHFACLKKKWCISRISDTVIMTLEDGRYIGFACDNARLIITPTRSKFVRCRSGAIVIDAETLRQTGAMEVSLNTDPQHPIAIRPSFTNEPRDWTKHRLYSWRDDAYSAHIPPEILPLINDSDE